VGSFALGAGGRWPARRSASEGGFESSRPDHFSRVYSGDGGNSLDPRVAEFVSEREWHRSQEIEARADGSLLVRLTVCDDRPLRSWIHSFGPLARVVAPARLAREVFQEIEDARELYMPRLTLDMVRVPLTPRARVPLRAKRV
jgi:hypothetical protein